MSTTIKAARLLAKLYTMWRGDFTLLTLDDMLAKASPEEIDFYYQKILEEQKNV
jgi:hypothetical protein